MAWQIEYSTTAKRALKKLDRQVARQILDYMSNQVANRPDPRSLGKALTGDLGGFWRYRVEDYRLICEIRDNQITVLVLKIGHRKMVYD